jgi:hypothetical protein
MFDHTQILERPWAALSDRGVENFCVVIFGDNDVSRGAACRLYARLGLAPRTRIEVRIPEEILRGSGGIAGAVSGP